MRLTRVVILKDSCSTLKIPPSMLSLFFVETDGQYKDTVSLTIKRSNESDLWDLELPQGPAAYVLDLFETLLRPNPTSVGPLIEQGPHLSLLGLVQLKENSQAGILLDGLLAQITRPHRPLAASTDTLQSKSLLICKFFVKHKTLTIGKKFRFLPGSSISVNNGFAWGNGKGRQALFYG